MTLSPSSADLRPLWAINRERLLTAMENRYGIGVSWSDADGMEVYCPHNSAHNPNHRLASFTHLGGVFFVCHHPGCPLNGRKWGIEDFC